MIEKLVEGALDGMFAVVPVKDECDIEGAVANWLRSKGWHVCENDNDLRELALSETDLVEPDAE